MQHTRKLCLECRTLPVVEGGLCDVCLTWHNWEVEQILASAPITPPQRQFAMLVDNDLGRDLPPISITQPSTQLEYATQQRWAASQAARVADMLEGRANRVIAARLLELEWQEAINHIRRDVS